MVKVFKIHGFWENLFAAIGLSQLFNYLFVVIATLLKIYTQTTVLVLFGIEAILLLVFYYSTLRWNLAKIINPGGIIVFFDEYIAKKSVKVEWKRKVLKFFYYLAFVVAILCLIKYFFLYITQPTQVFTRWDAVVSWDNWATQWYQGVFPLHTEHYPQLWTTNLSIPYQFIGTTEVKYFSKYFANLIEFFIVFMVFILGVKRRSVGYFLGVFFTSWLMYVFGSQGSGYADSPVAFWGLLAISCLLLADGSEDDDKLILLGAFFVSGAALTKQAGLWLVLTYPILVAMLKSKTTKKSSAIVIQTFLMMLIMIAPWYVFKEIQILTGIETSEVGRVTSLVLDHNNFSEVINSAGSLFINTLKNNYFSKSFTFVILLILLAFSYKDKIWGWISSLIIIPFSIGWIFFFSYESRNLDLIIPLLGIALGVGLQKVLELDVDRIKVFFHKRVPLAITHFISKFVNRLFHLLLSTKIWILLLFIPLIFILPKWVSDNRLITNSLIKQRLIGDPPVNQLLYDYKEEYGLNGKIVTSYPYLGFLPELDQYYIYSSTKTGEFFDLYNDLEVGYALFNDHWWSEEVHNFIMSLLDDKKIDLIFSYPTPSGNGTFYFVTSCHGICK